MHSCLLYTSCRVGAGYSFGYDEARGRERYSAGRETDGNDLHSSGCGKRGCLSDWYSSCQFLSGYLVSGESAQTFRCYRDPAFQGGSALSLIHISTPVETSPGSMNEWFSTYLPIRVVPVRSKLMAATTVG